jgi:uncharacterized protein (DUF58 family)
MTASSSPKLFAYTLLSVLLAVGGLALGRPELIVLAAPFVLALALGLAAAHEPRLELDVALERDRTVDGDEIAVTIGVESSARVERLDLELPLPDGLAVAQGRPAAVALGPGERRELVVPVRCLRWGSYRVGDVLVRASDRYGAVAFEQRARLGSDLRVFPRPEQLRRLLPPLETQVFAGNEVARAKGEGIEFADLRPFVTGDAVRNVNWRASARRGELYVNERRAERNADVVLFLDSFAEVAGPQGTTLDAAVRAAAALAAGYLERRDRVGLIGFGGVLSWLFPSMGTTQLYRIVDALLETEVVFNYAWKDIDLVPTRTLPPKALVIALSPLLDDRSTNALADLRARGFDLVVVEISPTGYCAASEGELSDLARRLWRLRRDALRFSFERLGVAVVEWREDLPLAATLEDARSFRRYARGVRS